MTVSNPAAPTYFPRPLLDIHGNPISPTAGVSWVQQIWTANKVARYRPILGDLAADPDHLAIFLVEATGEEKKSWKKSWKKGAERWSEMPTRG